MFYFKDDSNLTVYFSDGNFGQWKMNDPDISRILKLIEKSDWVQVKALYNPAKAILDSKDISSNSNGIVLTTKDNVKVDIPFKENKYTITSLTDLLVKKGYRKKDLVSIKNFLRKTIENKYINAVEEIFLFCKEMDFEICPDGDFLAYKEVNYDFTSIYDGITFHNLGEYVTVKNFCTDREIACAEGLHFCSKEYLKNMSSPSTITIAVKIDPRDVVSVPIDHNYQKGRCCRYLPVCVLKDGKTLKAALSELDPTTKVSVKESSKISNKKDKKFVYNFCFMNNLSTKEASKETGLAIRTIQKYYKEFREVNHD